MFTIWLIQVVGGKVNDEVGGVEILIGKAALLASPHGFWALIFTPKAFLSPLYELLHELVL